MRGGTPVLTRNGASLLGGSGWVGVRDACAVVGQGRSGPVVLRRVFTVAWCLSPV